MTRIQFFRTNSETSYLILKRISVDVLLNKYFIILDIIVFSISLIFWILQVLYLISHWSVDLLVNYCNSLSGQLYALISMFELLRFNTITRELYSAKNSLFQLNWINHENVRKKINESSRFAVLLAFFLFVSTAAWFVSAAPVRQVSKQYLPYAIFEEYFGEETLLTQIFCCICWIAIPYVCYVSSILGFLLLVVVLQLKAQLQLIMDNFSNTPEEYQNLDEMDLFHSQTYQDDMYVKIRQLIKDQRLVKSTLQGILDKTLVTNALYLVAGFITLMCGIYSALHQYRNENFQYISILVPFAAVTLSISFLYWECGQVIQDESTRCFDMAFNSKWYIWNKKNRQALQLFMVYNLKPQILSVVGLAAADYNFAVQVMRVSGSTALTLHSLQF